MARTKLVVAGALGVVGRAVVERFAGRTGVELVALSRRAPDFAPEATWLACDLRDRDAARRALGPHRDATHLVYAALFEKPGLARGWLEPDHVEVNREMLRSALDALEGAPLAHVTLMQGTKAYGVHTGRPMRVPARERDERRDHPNFYFAQQDLLVERAARAGFAWTALRPQIVLGVAVGSAMNPVAALGAYAVLLREQGLPLAFPGHPHALAECTDARIVAEAIEWAWREPRAHGAALNLANGDVLVWSTLFERLAGHFAMPLGPPAALRPSEAMPKLAALWRRIAEREDLRVRELDALIGLSWHYADATWAAPAALPVPPLVSTLKARRLGFGACIDSEECVVEHLDAMRAQRYLPAR